MAKTRGSSGARRKTVTVPYERAPEFKYIPSTGVLVRGDRDAIVLTYYVDDLVPREQVGKFKKTIPIR